MATKAKETDIKTEIKMKEEELRLLQNEITAEQKALLIFKEDLEKKSKNLDKDKINILQEKDSEIESRNSTIDELKAKESLLKALINKLTLEQERKKQDVDIEISKYRADEHLKVQEKLINKIKEDTRGIAQDFENKILTLSKSVTLSREELDKAYESLVNEYEEALKTKLHLYDEKLKDVDNAKKILEEEINKSEAILEKEATLSAGQLSLQKREKLLEKRTNHLVEEKYKALITDKEQLEDNYNNLSAKYKQLAQEYSKLRDIVSSGELINAVKTKSDYDSVFKQYTDLLKKFKEYSTTDIETLNRKANEYDVLNDDFNAAQDKISELNEQLIRNKTQIENSASLKYHNEVLENRIALQTDLLTKLQEDIDILESRLDNKKASNVASEAIETPLSEFENLEQSNANITESDWLTNIENKCKESGYEFSNRLFNSFHTSLMCSDMSPLTVLAGVSGTGKSKLPQLYSRFGGLYFLSVPVQPDYDSPQSLFGYFNSIEKRFNATSLLRAIVPFQKDKSSSANKDKILDLSNNVLLVLLDEMNLAHIELYFSDLLSKLEERRDGNDNVGFEVDLGAGNEKYKVALTDNVKWIGTMNEDETTKSLSDKVIDRGNIISFPRPKDFVRFMDRRTKKIANEAPKLSRKVWDSWGNDKIVLTDEEANKYMIIVSQINDAMGYANRAIGHRVWQSIEDYMISHPLVKKYKDDKNKRMQALKYAFEEVVVYKIMPKLRGIETDGEQKTKCLTPILTILESNHLTSIIDDYKNAMNSVTNTFYWSTSEFLNKEYTFED